MRALVDYGAFCPESTAPAGEILEGMKGEAKGGASWMAARALRHSRGHRIAFRFTITGPAGGRVKLSGGGRGKSPNKRPNFPAENPKLAGDDDVYKPAEPALIR